MNRTSKQQLVTELTEKLANAQAVFLTDFRGMNVEQATQLRNDLRKVNTEYRVVKNTLLERATRDTDKASLSEHFTGPTAVAFTSEDPVATARILARYAKEQQNVFRLKGGVLSGKSLTVADITALAELPSREVLIAKLLGTLNAPAANFVGVLAAVPGSFVRALDAIRRQKEAA